MNQLDQRQCYFCTTNKKYIDWRDTETLRRFLTMQGKISRPGRTGLDSKHQRMLARAIKKARIMGLLPFITR